MDELCSGCDLGPNERNPNGHPGLLYGLCLRCWGKFNRNGLNKTKEQVMQVTKEDKELLNNIQNILKRATFQDMKGTEVTSFGACYQLLDKLAIRVSEQLKLDEKPDAVGSEV